LIKKIRFRRFTINLELQILTVYNLDQHKEVVLYDKLERFILQSVEERSVVAHHFVVNLTALFASYTNGGQAVLLGWQIAALSVSVRRQFAIARWLRFATRRGLSLGLG